MENKTQNSFWLGLGVGVVAIGLVACGALNTSALMSDEAAIRARAKAFSLAVAVKNAAGAGRRWARGNPLRGPPARGAWGEGTQSGGRRRECGRLDADGLAGNLGSRAVAP